MQVGDIITVGHRRKKSIWSSNLRGGKKAKILWIDRMEYNQEKVYGIALLEDMEKEGFDPELNYYILYENEISTKE